MRPHTHDGPISCCAVKPSLSPFTYSRRSRWRCGSPGGVGGASYPAILLLPAPCCLGNSGIWPPAYLPRKVILSLPHLHHRRLLYRGAGKGVHALQHMSPCVSKSARKWCSDLPYIRHMATEGPVGIIFILQTWQTQLIIRSNTASVSFPSPSDTQFPPHKVISRERRWV